MMTLRKKLAYSGLELALWLISLVILIPFYYLFINTVKQPQDATEHPLSLPHVWNFQSYLDAWTKMEYPVVFGNTVMYMVISVFIIIVLASTAAYALVRRKTRYHAAIYYLFVGAIMMPYQMMIMPLYRIVKVLHLMNTVPGVVFVYVFTALPFAIFLYCGFMRSLPLELEEAACVDGSSVYRTFVSIVFPLLRPVTATVIVLKSIEVWNDFMTQLLFIQSSSLQTITRKIYTNVGLFTTDWTSLLPMFVLGIAPMLLFYLMMQKNIIKGISAGSIKG
ncbi:carbohydrate ABC transporter permease [Paenibacillus sp. GCM10027626]|uniref:carbohydrate ABC transporter permease n=1 Tax=Paenibacillus sp. GCM10027626 TaxID=3273411 RepID=UPI00363B2293